MVASPGVIWDIRGASMSHRVPLALTMVVFVLVMAGTVGAQPAPVVPTTILPEFVVAPPGITPAVLSQGTDLARESYRAAVAHADLLAAMPCTCGCMDPDALAHRNNLDCYIERTYPDGTVAFTTHGLGCGICQLITRDAVDGAAAGLSVTELQELVMERYGPQSHQP
jgi:hypothetical protein